MSTREERQRPHGHHALLLEIAAMLTERERPAWELIEAAAERLSAHFGDTFIVSLLSDDGRFLHPLGLADPDPEVGAVLDSLAGMRWPADRGFSRHVLDSLTSVLLAETSPEVVVVGRPELAPYAERFGISSGVLAPMRFHGAAVGHVAGLRRRAGDPYTDADAALVQSVADWLALAVQCSGPQAPATAAAASRPEERTAGLTAREREILVLIALGHTNREVAEQLVLSVRTVEWHRARIQWKLGVTGRAALAAAARSQGLLE
jgi:DNA-binding CsgD family transcriptional regulator